MTQDDIKSINQRPQSFDSENLSSKVSISLGVVGYSATPFDHDKARYIFRSFLLDFLKKYPNSQVKIVAGYTALGMPLIAYEEARKLGLQTVGVATPVCSQYKCWDCDEVFIIGESWGDESELFLSKIDYLVKIGGNAQSIREFQSFIGPKSDYPLSPLESVTPVK